MTRIYLQGKGAGAVVTMKKTRVTYPSPPSPPTLLPLSLSSNTIAENVPNGTIIGNVVGTSPGSTITMQAGSDARLTVNLSGGVWRLLTTGATIDYEAATSLSFGLVETLAGATGNPKTTAGLSVTITNLNDTNPSAFTFTDQTNVVLSSLRTSNTITIAGLGASDSAATSISGDASSQFQKNGGAWTATPVSVVNGDTLAVRHNAAATNSAQVNTTLTVGTTSDTFSSTTVAASGSLTAPVLTKTSATGHNPMSWDSLYTDLRVDDVIRLSWTKNGVATEETHTVTSDDVIAASDPDIGRAWAWAGYAAAAASFVVGDVITVKERQERTGSTPSNYSNIPTDTIAGSVSVAYLGGADLAYGYGSGAISTAAIPVTNGDKLLIALSMSYNTATSHTITAKDAANNPVALTQIGATLVNGGGRLQLFRVDTVAVGTITLTITPNASTQDGVVLVAAIRGAQAGAPAASALEARAITNPDPIDVDEELAIPANGRVVVAFLSGGPHTYSGGTKIADIANSVRLSLGVQSVAGDLGVAGQPSGGPGYQTVLIGATSWSP